MRLTFVLPCFSPRPIGGLRVVYEFANHLASRGHSVTIVHPRQTLGAPSGLLRALRASVEQLLTRGVPPWMPIDPKVNLKVSASLDEGSVPDGDVIFATNPPTARVVSALSPAKGRKHYLVMDFYPFLGSREMLEDSWRSGFQIATISRWLQQLVIAAGVPRQSVAWVSCGVSRIHSLRNPIAKRVPSIAVMFGLANYKAPLDGVRAIAMAREGYGHVPVRVFGANMRRRPRELPPWIEYYPLVSDKKIAEILNSSSIFVSSSLAEGFCLPAAEAMSCGCAIAATDSGGIRDFASDEENALLSHPGQPHVLAENIGRILRDDALRVRLAQAGHQAMRAQTWEAATDRLEASFGAR